MGDPDETPYYEQQIQNAQRAIGRYFVEFSMLLYSMRELLIHRLRPDPLRLGYLALGEASAHHLRDAFFGACRTEIEHDEAENKVSQRLRGFVIAEGEQRNYFAHGDWFLGLGALGIVPVGTVQVVRIRPVRSDGTVEVAELTALQIDDRSDKIAEYRHLIVDYGEICFQIHEPYIGMRVSDVLVKRGDEVVREGPKASLL